MAVFRLGAGDWRAYRTIRLAMLQESPSAFGSTHHEAAGYTEQLWRQRLKDNFVLLARVGQTPAGSAMYSEYGAGDPGTCFLFGMWVGPGFRRAGVARALVEAVVTHARTAGKRRVVTRVVAGNDAARRLYQGAGFVPTGNTLPHPPDHTVSELEMQLIL